MLEQSPFATTATAAPEKPEPEPVIRLTQDGLHLKRLLTDLERSLIHQALEMSDGNRTRAARLLNINRTTLIEKVKRIG